MTKALKSANVSTNNILLKVTVPKRTRLKRRRGSDSPFDQGTEVRVSGERARPMLEDAQYLFRSMRDNTKSYQVEAVGTIDQTHRFRGMQIFLLRFVSCALIHSGMPDFVTSTENMPLLQKMREHILPFNCEILYSYKAPPLTVGSGENERFRHRYGQRRQAKFRDHPASILDPSHSSFQLLVRRPKRLTNGQR